MILATGLILKTLINYGRKKFNNIAPGANHIVIGVNLLTHLCRVNATKNSVRYRTPVVVETLPELQLAQECLLKECQRAW